MSEEKLIIGDLLRQKREELKLNINEVATKLKVKKDYILFVESENFAAFDKNFYTKAFIKSYAKLLKIEDSLIEEKLRETLKTENNKTKKGEGLIFEDKDLSPNKTTTQRSALALILIVIILLISFTFSQNNNVDRGKILEEFYEKEIK